MVNSNVDALGILFPNSYDSFVPELVAERSMASIPFAGRYRMVDFLLSSMVNCGIDNISIIVRQNYHSLMDHLGSGREWDLVRKNGGLNIVPPYAEKHMKIYNGRVEALASILPFLKEQKEKYVVMADTNIAASFDFNALLNAHKESGADVTIVYKKEKLPESARKSDVVKDLYYTLGLEGSKVRKIYMNSQEEGIQNFSMNIYVMERERLINEINTAFVRGYTYFERDINGAKAKNVLVADGCVIEGEVENCVLFRGVKVARGAKVKNCVLMQDTVVQEGARLEYVITDKNVTISVGKELYGTDSFQVYVAKYQTV